MMLRLFSTQSIKKAHYAHKALGVCTAALLYLTCLTGTLSVFFEEFERWEQPYINESLFYSPDQIHQAIRNFHKKVRQPPKTIWLVLPTPSMPRMHVSDGEHEWFVNGDGSLSESPAMAWTAMLTKLHMQLHLPENVGFILVGVLGVLLCSLIISGFFAHPNIIKNAFHWRLGRPVLTQVDIHNRLSIWALPFYLMSALSGAFIGLIGLFSVVSGFAFYGNDNDALLAKIFGDDPVVRESSHNLDFEKALNELKNLASEAKPIYLAIHQIDTDQQYFEIAATLPQRLIYSEIYRFQADGVFIDKQGFSDGEGGRQVAYSLYRLHFGHYGGFVVKVAYGLLGLALTWTCASGINIWLARRKVVGPINDLWVAVVWGLPLALSASALLSIFGLTPLGFFCVTEFLVVIFSLGLKNPHNSAWFIKAALVIVLGLIVVSQFFLVGLNTSVTAYYGVSAVILVSALLMGASVFRQRYGVFNSAEAKKRLPNC